MSDVKKSSPRKRSTKIINRIFALVIILVIFFFLAKNLYQNWQKITSYQWHINIGYLIVSFFILIAGLIFLGYLWQQILKRLHGAIPFKQAGRIWFLSGIARYIPGALWQIAGLAYLGQKEGISIVTSTLSAALAQLLSIIAGIVVGSQILFRIRLSNQPWTFYFFPILIVVVSLIFVYPPLFRKFINFFMKKTGRPAIEFGFHFTDLLFFLVLYIAGWLIIGAAFALFVKSFTTIHWTRTVPLIPIFSASYIIGFLSIITPSGLGVREGALVLFLHSYFAVPIATVIAFGARIWITIGELACLAIFLVFSRKKAPSADELYTDDYYHQAVSAMEQKNRFFRTRLNNIRTLTAPQRNDQILDLGSGMGTISLEFSKLGAQMTGIDLSQRAVSTAQRLARDQNLNGLEFVRADATRLPFKNDVFDKVVSADLVEHLTAAETINALQESHRVLRPQGRLSLYTPSPTHLFEKLKKRNIVIKNDPSHVALKNVSFLRPALNQAGFRIEKITFAPSHILYFRTLERLFMNLPAIGGLFRRRICIVALKS
jgi:ubiquinone/menaquinone biosynthesis C-methylase UbiE